MSIQLRLSWDEVETPTYEQMEHAWGFSPEYENSGYSDEGDHSTQQSSRYKVTHHFSNGYITKLYDNEVNEFFYCINNYFGYDYHKTKNNDWGNYVVSNSVVKFYPKHYEITAPHYTGSKSLQQSFTGISFWAIPWKEYIPSGFVYERDLQDEKFVARGFLLDGHSRDFVEDRFYKFNYDGTPLNEEQFTVPKKFRVNRKKMKALRQGKLQKLRDYILGMWNIYPDRWSREEANQLYRSACLSDDDNYKHLVCALLNESVKHMPQPTDEKLSDTTKEWIWHSKDKRTPDRYLNSLEREVKQQHYKEVLEPIDEPQSQLGI